MSIWRERRSVFALAFIFCTPFAIRAHRHKGITSHRFNVLCLTETQSSPVLVDGNLPYAFKTHISQHLPACISVKITGIFLRGSLGISKPEYRIRLQEWD